MNVLCIFEIQQTVCKSPKDNLQTHTMMSLTQIQ